MDRYTFCLAAIILLLAGCRPEPQDSLGWDEALQAIVTRSIDSSEVDALIGQIPYESITFERGACYGDCPVYRVTFHRDGSAELITNPRSLGRAESFSGVIDYRNYSRLAQLVDLARSRTTKAAYSGGWTDDYTAVISAHGALGDWTVSDYGQVAPSEIWILEQILHKIRTETNWNQK